jgi:uncharacterized protein (DUF58 family)
MSGPGASPMLQSGLAARLWHRLGLLARPRAPEPLPARIHRGRVYVLPSGFGLFFGAVVGAMLLGALNYNNNPALLLAFVLAAAIHNSLVRAHLTISGIVLEALHAEPVHAGTPLRLRCVLQSHDQRRRPGLQLQGGPAFELLPQQRQEACLEIPTRQRGWLAAPRMKLATRHPLGMAVAWCWFWPERALLVYPAAEAAAPPLPLDSGEGQRMRRDPMGGELHHLRDYRPGDPLRQIAWKSSARNERLLVREYESGGGSEINLDWAQLGALPVETRIRRLTRWVLDAEHGGLRYRLRLPGQELGPGHGPEHRHACLRALALLPRG